MFVCVYVSVRITARHQTHDTVRTEYGREITLKSDLIRFCENSGPLIKNCVYVRFTKTRFKNHSF